MAMRLQPPSFAQHATLFCVRRVWRSVRLLRSTLECELETTSNGVTKKKTPPVWASRVTFGVAVPKKSGRPNDVPLFVSNREGPFHFVLNLALTLPAHLSV